MTPLSAHDKFADGFSYTRSGFAVAVGLGQGSRVAGIAHCERCDRIPARRNFKNLARGVRIESGHLVNQNPARSGFWGEVRHGRAGVVMSIPIWRIVLGECQLRYREAENVRVLGPVDVKFHERLQRLCEVFAVVSSGHDKRPWLFIATRWSPPRFLKQTSQILSRDFSFR